MSTATLESRVESLEYRMTRQENLAGPGQNEAFSRNLIEIRERLDKFGRVQEQHGKKLDRLATVQDEHTRKTDTLTADVAGLKTDVATLKTDMGEVKGTLREILDRLPAKRGE